MIVRLFQTVLFGIGAALLAVLLFWRVEAIQRGGPVMVPIIMCSIFALSITLERILFFMTVGADANALIGRLRGLIQRRRWVEAEKLCEEQSGPVGRVALAGLRRRDHEPQELEAIMGEVAHEEMPQIERHHRWLATLAQVATLLGLLGTVIGMVAAFQTIQVKATSASPVSPGDLAGGIWEALITTAAGLEVAIPTILAYNYFVSRVGNVQYQMEKVAAVVANWRRGV